MALLAGIIAAMAGRHASSVQRVFSLLVKKVTWGTSKLE
jgi:hypothetical protein